MRSGATGLALGSVFSSFVVPARAATVFDNYTGNTPESFGAAYVAAGFMPTGNFDFTGEAAFVQSRDATPQPFTLSLYSSATDGSPDSTLWTSDELSVSAAGSLVGVTYSGPAIALKTGVEYFVVLRDLGPVNWFVGGSASVPSYTSSDGSNWLAEGPVSLQFTVDGAPGAAAAPEACTWLMMVAGASLLFWRRRRRQPVGELVAPPSAAAPSPWSVPVRQTRTRERGRARSPGRRRRL
jgi:hypothetical protein